MTVELDESLFAKRKSNKGRILPPQWVVGGICRQTRQVFMECVDDRTAETLCNVIWNNIHEGTIVRLLEGVTDCWKGYRTEELKLTKYEHLTVNHKYNFVNPVTGPERSTAYLL